MKIFKIFLKESPFKLTINNSKIILQILLKRRNKFKIFLKYFYFFFLKCCRHFPKAFLLRQSSTFPTFHERIDYRIYNECSALKIQK